MSKKLPVVIGITAAVLTTLICTAAYCGYIFLPRYSAPHDRTVKDSGTGIVINQKGRKLEVSDPDRIIWSLPKGVYAQDFLYDDIDGDDEKELLVLCWKRGRYGKERPTWVKRDEIKWSQHIFIYEVKPDAVTPKWMASDTGVKVRSWEIRNGILIITDTKGAVTKWKWIHWGLEKL